LEVKSPKKIGKELSIYKFAHPLFQAVKKFMIKLGCDVWKCN
jgi:hypothetical protein